jgi:hypothetical protein
MNKLETITELLVNELTDFENNINRLESSLEKAENLKVKFDLVPVQQFISQLDSFQKMENSNRREYVERLSGKLKQAKIYPKWAVITFMCALIISFGGILYGYTQIQSIAAKEKEAYNQGLEAYGQYMNSFFEENPKSHTAFKKWKENQ